MRIQLIKYNLSGNAYLRSEWFFSRKTCSPTILSFIFYPGMLSCLLGISFHANLLTTLIYEEVSLLPTFPCKTSTEYQDKGAVGSFWWNGNILANWSEITFLEYKRVSPKWEVYSDQWTARKKVLWSMIARVALLLLVKDNITNPPLIYKLTN